MVCRRSGAHSPRTGGTRGTSRRRAHQIPRWRGSRTSALFHAAVFARSTGQPLEMYRVEFMQGPAAGIQRPPLHLLRPGARALPKLRRPLLFHRTAQRCMRADANPTAGDVRRNTCGFLALTRAGHRVLPAHGAWAPQIFHCNDWHTAFAPLLLKSVYAWDQLFAETRTVLTIHNIGYQGVFGAAFSWRRGSRRQKLPAASGRSRQRASELTEARRHVRRCSPPPLAQHTPGRS